MQATITYLLSEQAQREAIAATGQPVSRKITVIEELPADLLAASWLVKIAEDGSISADISTKPSVQYGKIDPTSRRGHVLHAVPQSGVQALRDLIAVVEKEHAENKTFYGQQEISRQEYASKEAARRAAGAAEYEAKQAAEAAKEAAKTAYIATWMAEHADPEMREQFEAGLLARKDVLTAIVDHELASLPPEEGYAICSRSEHDCTSQTIETLPRKVWPAWKTLKAKLPPGSTFAFNRVIPCLQPEDAEQDYGRDDDGLGAEMITAKLSVPVGPFTFGREVRLDPAN